MNGIKVRQVELRIPLTNNPHQSAADYVDLCRSVGLAVFETGIVHDPPNMLVLASSTKGNKEIMGMVMKLAVIFNQKGIRTSISQMPEVEVRHPRYDDDEPCALGTYPLCGSDLCPCHEN